MPASDTTKLYTPRLLALSSSLASYPLIDAFERRVQARSRTCGSDIELGVDTDADGRVERVGMQVAACAVGQSSAAILAQGATGQNLSDFAAALAQIEEWFDARGPLPDWPEFGALEAERDHPYRRGALVMPWTDIVLALST